jgi:hypothetical protein
MFVSPVSFPYPLRKSSYASATASVRSPTLDAASLTGGIVLDQTVAAAEAAPLYLPQSHGRWLMETICGALGGPALSLDKAQMPQGNSQISLVTAQLFYRPPATSNALAFPTNRSKQTKHRAKFCKVLDRR